MRLTSLRLWGSTTAMRPRSAAIIRLVTRPTTSSEKATSMPAWSSLRAFDLVFLAREQGIPIGLGLGRTDHTEDTTMKISPIAAVSTSSLSVDHDETSTVSLEHTPVDAYFVLRRLAQAPIETKALFGFSNEGLVQFLVSRGLAVEVNGLVSITRAGHAIGEIPDDRDGTQRT
jgi:hypothetical protein